MGSKLGDTATDIGKGGKCGQITLVIINLLFIVLGIITLAIGAWAIASGSSFSFLTGSQIIGGSAVLIIAGGAAVIIAAIGVFGAICKNRPLLFIYAVVVSLIVIAEIVVGIVAFIYRDEVAAGIQNGIEENLIVNYNASNPSSDENSVVNFFQNTFQCCGFNDANDWSELNVDAIIMNNGHPPMCLMCVTGQQNCQQFFYNQTITVGGLIFNETKSFNTTDVGCASVNTNALLALAIGAGVIGIIVGFLEIIGVILALLLCCCISRAKKQEVV